MLFRVHFDLSNEAGLQGNPSNRSPLETLLWISAGRSTEPFTLYGKIPGKKLEPGHPGTHYIDLDLEQFIPRKPFCGEAVADAIAKDPRFKAVSHVIPRRKMSGMWFTESETITIVDARGGITIAWGTDFKEMVNLAMANLEHKV